MIKASDVRATWKKAGNGRAFRDEFRKSLGIVYDPKLQQNRYVPTKDTIAAEEFSIAGLTREFLGGEAIEDLATGPMSSSLAEAISRSTSSSQKALFEDAAPVTPSSLQDINAWTATLSGLVEVKLLEGYNSPEFITDELVTVMPRRTNGGKMIAVPYPRPGDVRVVAPGIEFPNTGLNELYVWARPNIVAGDKLSLDRNTVVYDLSGELMSSAETLGKSLKYVQEYLRFAHIYGLNRLVSSSIDQSITGDVVDSFRMNATAESTANPTYQSTGVTTNGNFYNYVNLTTNTPIVDWTSLRTYRNLLNLMRDPVNNLPFDTEITDILADPYYGPDLQYVLHQSQVFRFTGNTATAPYQGTGATMPPFGAVAPNAPPGSSLFNWRPHFSNIAHQVLLDGGVTEANSQKYVVVGSPKKAFVWQQAWDLRVDQANPTSADMISRNIVNLWVAQWSGQFVVREPRYCILGTN